MSSDFEKLRRLVNEELGKLDEYRPNTFMLSHMEEQDQDGDGDEDFDDVRVARYTKGGMSRQQALAKVKRKPMGDNGKKHEGEGIAESMRRMTRIERKMLHEAVKRRILQEQDAARLPPLSGSQVGTSLMKGDKEIFRKTEAGWKTTVRVTLDQIMRLIKPEVAKTIQKELEALPEGENFEILKGSLINPELASNTNGKLIFQRDGDLFADPSVVPDAVIDDSELTAKVPTVGQVSASGSAENGQIGKYAIGDAIIVISDNKIEIRVRDAGDGTFRGFEDIFGRDANIPDMIQSAKKRRKEKLRLKSDKVRTLIFNLSDAAEKSVLGFFARKSFPLFGTSQIKFYQSADEKEFSAEIPLTDAQKKAVIGMLAKLAEAGRAKRLE